RWPVHAVDARLDRGLEVTGELGRDGRDLLDCQDDAASDVYPRALDRRSLHPRAAAHPGSAGELARDRFELVLEVGRDLGPSLALRLVDVLLELFHARLVRRDRLGIERGPGIASVE